MTATKSFTDLVRRRATADPLFADALLFESVDAMLGGDWDSGRTMLQNYIEATIGFAKLATATGKRSGQLVRMFGPGGNPRASHLWAVIGQLQEAAGLKLHLAGPAKKDRAGNAPAR